ncbi:hypothetical protein CJU90_3788 [Yarrowia sp. C11]|nr:hypothetical protein CKK34_5398 [Yarrowia sp. E02]KAG5367491.1 hypothetical protein CJU90_3788 [Yarrowia sp. C11]
MADLDPLQKPTSHKLKQSKSQTSLSNLTKTKSHTPNPGSKNSFNQTRPRRLSAELKRSFDVRRADFTAALEEKKSSLSPNLKKLNPINFMRRKSSKDDFINIANVYEDPEHDSRTSREFSARDFSSRDINVFTPTFATFTPTTSHDGFESNTSRDLHPTMVSHDIISSSRDPETGVIYATRKCEWGTSPGSSKTSVVMESPVMTAVEPSHVNKKGSESQHVTRNNSESKHVSRNNSAKLSVITNPLEIPDPPIESLRVVKKSSGVGLNILMGDTTRDSLPARDSPRRASFSFPNRDFDSPSRGSFSRESPSKGSFSRESPSRTSFSRDSPSRTSFSRDSPSRASFSRDVPAIPVRRDSKLGSSRRQSLIGADTNTWEVPPRDSRRNSRVMSDIVAESDLVAIADAAESARLAEAASIARAAAERLDRELAQADAKAESAILDTKADSVLETKAESTETKPESLVPALDESHDTLSHDTLSRGQNSLRSSNTGHTSFEQDSEKTEKTEKNENVISGPSDGGLTQFTKQLMAQDGDNSFGGLLEDDSDSAFSFEDDDFGRNSSVRLHKKPERFTTRDLSDGEEDYDDYDGYDEMYDEDGLEDDAHLYGGGNAFLDQSSPKEEVAEGDILPSSLTNQRKSISRGKSHGRGLSGGRQDPNGGLTRSRRSEVPDSEFSVSVMSPASHERHSSYGSVGGRKHSKRLASYHGGDDSNASITPADSPGPVAVTTDDPGYQRQKLSNLFKFPPDTAELSFDKSGGGNRSRDGDKSRDFYSRNGHSRDVSNISGDHTIATSSPHSRHVSSTSTDAAFTSGHSRQSSGEKRRSYKFPPSHDEEFSFESHDSSFNNTITEQDYEDEGHDSTAFAYQEVEDALSEIESLTQSGCSSPIRSRYEIPSLGETLGHARNLSNLSSPSYLGSPSHARNLSSPSHVRNSSQLSNSGHIRSVSGSQALQEPLEIDTGFTDYDQYGFGYPEGDFEAGGYSDEYYDDLLDEANAVSETYYEEEDNVRSDRYSSRLERSHSNRKLPRKVIHVNELNNNVVESRDGTTTLYGLINDEVEEARSIVTTPVNQQCPFDPVSGLPMPGYVELTPISERSYDGDSPYRR